MLSTTYNPGGLLDAVIAKHGLKNDAALSRFLDISTPEISRFRSGRHRIGPSLILKCIEIGGMDLPAIRSFIGGEA